MKFGRYLAVGVWNTVFGYATFSAFTYSLRSVVPHSYMAATLLSSLLNITVAFLGYKWFVFRTEGNYLREWCRCVAVYSGGIGLSLVILPVFVYGVKELTGDEVRAPYVAGALTAGITALAGYWGHSRISFR